MCNARIKDYSKLAGLPAFARDHCSIIMYIGELDDKTLLGRASHLIHKNELTFTKTIFNDIFHINTKSVLFEHVPHGRNGLIDSLRVIFNDYDTDNMNYARMLLRF